MAWTAPRTYVIGEVLTASVFNTDHRDNLLALSTHGHSGAAGDGGTTLGDLVKETFSDAVAPSAPGASKTAIYTTSGRLRYRAGAAGADTLLSDENHVHPPITAGQTEATENYANTTNGSAAPATASHSVSDSITETDIRSASHTPAAINRSLVGCGGIAETLAAPAPATDVTFRLYFDAVEKRSVIFSIANVSGLNYYYRTLIWLESDVSVAAHTFKVTLQSATDRTAGWYSTPIAIEEVTV